MYTVRKNPWIEKLCALLPFFLYLTGISGLVHTFRFSTGQKLTGLAKPLLGTLISPVLTGRSNDQERRDQAVVHAP
jgi:hypothetical protein